MCPGSVVHTDVLAARTTWEPGPIVGPRGGVQSVADRHRHQLVVGGVVFDLVDAVAVAVVGVQDWLVSVGQLAPALRLRATGECAELSDLVEAPLPTLPDERLGQHGRRRGVEVLQLRDLIGDDVRIGHASILQIFDSRTRCVRSA